MLDLNHINPYYTHFYFLKKYLYFSFFLKNEFFRFFKNEFEKKTKKRKKFINKLYK
jgi:hypothetical protein